MAQINACDSCEYRTCDKAVCWCAHIDSKLYGQENPCTEKCDVWEQYQPEE